MAGSLQGIRVLDLTRVLAGPWATQTLADLGAEVIKIERPGSGDDTRAAGPPFLKDKNGNDTPDSAYYLSANRGKKSVAINIATAEGQEIVRKLAATADVFVENYLVGKLAEYGLDYERSARDQSASRLLLDHRVRPNGAIPRSSRLRFHLPGHGRDDEHHR